MKTRFNILKNTPSDGMKAAGVSVTTFSAAYAFANSDGLVTTGEWIGLVASTVIAGLAALGLWVKEEEQEEGDVDVTSTTTTEGTKPTNL